MGELAGGGFLLVAVGVSDMWEVTGDTRHMTHHTCNMTHDRWKRHMTFDAWHMTHVMWHLILFSFFFFKKFSVSRIQDFHWGRGGEQGNFFLLPFFCRPTIFFWNKDQLNLSNLKTYIMLKETWHLLKNSFKHGQTKIRHIWIKRMMAKIKDYIYCILKSWVHKIVSLYRTVYPWLGYNYASKCCSDNFPRTKYISPSVENCQNYIVNQHWSAIVGRRSWNGEKSVP